MKKKFLLSFLISFLVFSLVFFIFGQNIFLKEKEVASIGEEEIELEEVDLGEDNKIEQIIKDELLFLMVGVDANGVKRYKGIRTDTIMLAKINFDTGKVDIVSIPRDTRVPIKGKMDRINHAHSFGGVQLTMRTIREVFNLDVDYYVKVDYKVVMDLVDAVGGVEINVPFDMNYQDFSPEIPPLDINIKKGIQTLNGKKAHDYLRWRKNNDGTVGYPEGDVGRIKAQQNFLKELIKQSLKPKTLLKIPAIIESYYDNVYTNVSLDIMLKSALKIKNIDLQNINTMIIPGEGDYVNGVSYYLYDETKTEEMINTIFADYLLTN